MKKRDELSKQTQKRGSTRGSFPMPSMARSHKAKSGKTVEGPSWRREGKGGGDVISELESERLRNISTHSSRTSGSSDDHNDGSETLAEEDGGAD